MWYYVLVMTDSREPASGEDRTNTIRKGQNCEPNELFGVLGQLVDNLKLNNSDGKNNVVGNNGEPAEESEEFHGANEKVVEVIESLCMQCHENVCYPRLRQETDP